MKMCLIPPIASIDQINMPYAHEADVLNMALFGQTAKDWRDKNLSKKGNIRDYADVSQKVVLANLENTNAELIRQNVGQAERLFRLNEIAIIQMQKILKIY